MRIMMVLLSLVCLMSSPVRAGGAGAKGKVVLPPPQASVAVTIERGVRVWRPLGTTGGIETATPWPVRWSSSQSEGFAVPLYGAPAVGIAGGFGGYDGYGSRNGFGGKKNFRGHGFGHGRSGVSFGRPGGRMAFGGPRHGGRPRGHGHR